MLRTLEWIIIWTLAAVVVGMAIHTPVTVFIESNWPTYELLAKSWKEIVLGGILLLMAWYVWRRGLVGEILRDKLVVITALIAAVHVLLLLVIDNAYVSELAGLLIDLRFYLLFIELYIASKYIPNLRRPLLTAAAVGALVVAGFGVLQVSVLPKDILSHIGYSDATIKPYLTVDLNDNYLRINSTLRGPNPVGAFGILVLTAVGAWAMAHRARLREARVLVAIMAATTGGAVLLLWSHSRSAWLAAIAAAGALLFGVLPRKAALYSVATAVVVGALALGVLFAVRDNPTISHLFFHADPAGGSPEKSDDGHLDSLQYGAGMMLESPVGEGIGSTGSASLLSDSPVIVESQYFFMAHESGWLGLGLQLLLFALVMAGLWQRRRDWLAMAMFSSGVGLAVIGILLPVWADDTVSLYWWGLAGLALGSSAIIESHGKTSKRRESHKKAKRAT
jgi:hypothetical protein